jgi:urease gamma subunit
MHMSFEKIDPPEHPAHRAARAIKQLHIDNIAMIDSGFIFHDKDGKNVNAEMRAACVEQMAHCDSILENVQAIPAHLLEPVALMLEEAHARLSTEVRAELEAQQAVAKIEHDAEDLPEIGNYDNESPVRS